MTAEKQNKKNIQILLINPPTELGSMFGVGIEFVQKYEPLGLLYLAAVLRDYGYRVSVTDAFAEELSCERLKEQISILEPDVVGISTLTCSGKIVFQLGRWIKETFPEILVVLGNIHASVFAEQYLENNCCDAVVHGEGEYVFLKLVENFYTGASFDGISAVSFKDINGSITTASGAETVKDLSGLPFPARDLVRQELYNLSPISNQSYVRGDNNAAKTMITSRGCVNRCTFCSVHGNKVIRFNDALRIADEMELLEKDYNTSYVYIMDPLFMGNKKRLAAICSEIRKRKLKIRWGCDAHVNYIYPDIIREMADAGCYELSLGIESGVQRSLDIIKKGTTINRITESVDIIKMNSSIFIEGLFILGLPGETYEDSLETIRFAKSLNLDMAQFSILMPYPGSPLFNELRNAGKIDTGIKKDGSLDTSVWKRYSSYICFTDNDPIWVTPGLTHKDLKRLQKKALREFYLRPNQVLRNLKRIRPGNIFKALRIIAKGFF